MRHGLVNECVESVVCCKITGRFPHFKHRVHVGFVTHQPAPVSKTAVRAEDGAFALGGQDGGDMSFFSACHKRKIGETVTVIVHVAAHMQECAVARGCNGGIPFCGHRYIVALCHYHSAAVVLYRLRRVRTVL